ncbi:MAG: peptide deformylase [Patescibacteria group bacterium]|nr:peptide deformylase [Patescibacteria group bacterium]MDE2015711.1 peptide deformylase [Patescibacteria group bacterium]MDE2226769.1 peptide deformylase [Patescibacteria group bacterium]
MEYKIVTIENKKDEKFLRHKTQDFDFKKFSSKEINDLVADMRKAMREANGIGLSANQIGLTHKVFVAEVPNPKGGNKFYAVFNPKIEKFGEEKIGFEEGCLSVPLTYGEVERPSKLTLSGYDKKGKPVKIKAWGLLARVFQHEMDHLEGKLFIDRTKKINKISPEKRVHASKRWETQEESDK